MDATEILDIDWAAMKLRPRLTGLPMSVWITQKDGFPHDVRVKVASVHGGSGTWQEAASVKIRPNIELVAGSVRRDDLKLVTDWVALNRQTIIDFWNDNLDPDDVLALLKRLETD